MLSEEVALKPEDLLTNISSISDSKNIEKPLHGLDIMLNLNSVLMVMLLTNKILANVTEPSGSVEDRMNKVTELLLGINSECGLLFQRPMSLLILDAISTFSEMLQA
jgi:hypothetical protein